MKSHDFSVSYLSLCKELHKRSVYFSDHLSVCLCQAEELVVFPLTDEAQKAFSDLTTVGLLQQELQ